MSTTCKPPLPIISRAEYNARVARGERAGGVYAFVFRRSTTIQEHLTHGWDLRDEKDRQLDFGAASGPTTAALAVRNLGATFIVEEI